MEEERRREEKEKIPFWQVFFDDIFLLFLLGAAILLASYTIWGLMELVNVPPLKP